MIRKLKQYIAGLTSNGKTQSKSQLDIIRRCAYCKNSILILFFVFMGQQVNATGEHDQHKIPAKKHFSVTNPVIKVSAIEMMDTNNNPANLVDVLDKGPVVINFIFTSCTAICPILSSTFSQVQKRFNEIKVKNISLISFSIDPERDTPARLKQYAEKFNAGKQWKFYTGTKSNMLAVENIFENFRGNKMNHLPYTFIRINKDSQWLRLKGFVSASVIIQEINKASL